MGYLVCDKCRGYYKLQEGESPEDFEYCQCGGNLNYVQELNMHVTDELDPLDGINFCPECGTNIIKDSKLCEECGYQLKNDDNKEELSKQIKKELSPSKAIVRIIIGFIAIIIWLLIGVNITVIFSSMIQQTLGFTSYFYQNPIIFLLVAFLNIILGLIAYFFVGILWWAVFHILWSIRWFAGYIKYHKIK